MKWLANRLRLWASMIDKKSIVTFDPGSSVLVCPVSTSMCSDIKKIESKYQLSSVEAIDLCVKTLLTIDNDCSNGYTYYRVSSTGKQEVMCL